MLTCGLFCSLLCRKICAICTEGNLLVVCSVGVEITPHKQDHAYRVVDDLSFPLFHPSWGVRTLSP